jgi:hypothetical protein
MHVSGLMSILNSKFRLAFPLAVILSVRMLFAGLLYVTLIANGPGIGFKQFYETAPYSWLYLFSSWDTTYYLLTSIHWYPDSLSPLWAFSPLYPGLIRILLPLGIDPLLSAWLVASIAGAVSVIAFQKVAELYFSASRAAVTTVIYFLFPPVLLFSGVNYGEPLFLLLSLGTWFFAKKSQFLRSSLMAALCSLARPNGVLLVVPLFVQCVRRRKLTELPYLLMPIMAFVGWLLYGYFATGILFVNRVALTTFWGGNVAPTSILANIGDRIANAYLYGVPLPVRYTAIVVAGSLFVTFVIILAYRAYKIDGALGLYVLFSICLIIPYGFLTSPFSFARYFAFLFPIGLPLYTRRKWLIICAVVLFLVLDYFTWNAYLTDSFG